VQEERVRQRILLHFVVGWGRLRDETKRRMVSVFGSIIHDKHSIQKQAESAYLACRVPCCTIQYIVTKERKWSLCLNQFMRLPEPISEMRRQPPRPERDQLDLPIRTGQVAGALAVRLFMRAVQTISQ